MDKIGASEASFSDQIYQDFVNKLKSAKANYLQTSYSRAHAGIFDELIGNADSVEGCGKERRDNLARMILEKIELIEKERSGTFFENNSQANVQLINLLLHEFNLDERTFTGLSGWSKIPLLRAPQYDYYKHAIDKLVFRLRQAPVLTQQSAAPDLRQCIQNANTETGVSPSFESKDVEEIEEDREQLVSVTKTALNDEDKLPPTKKVDGLFSKLSEKNKKSKETEVTCDFEKRQCVIF